MSGGVPRALHLLKLDDAVLVAIEHGECLSNYVLPVRRELAEDGGHKFLKVDGPVAVVIENGEDLIGFRARASHAVVVQGLAELRKVQLPTPIRVHKLELPSQTDQTLGPTFDHFLTETTNNQLILLLMRHRTQGLRGGLQRLLGVRYVLRVLIVDIRHKWVPARFEASDLCVELLRLLGDPILLVGLRVIKGEHPAGGVTNTLIVRLGGLEWEILTGHP